MTTFAQKLVEIARSQVGVTEVNGSNCGPIVDQYKAATNLPPHESWPWCAAFVCWCVLQVINFFHLARFTFTRPTTAGAFDFLNWSRKQDNSTSSKRDPGEDIKAGDIVIFSFSHIGIAVEDANTRTHTVTTVDGNTDTAGSREGGGVFEKTRSLSKVWARIRFNV